MTTPAERFQAFTLPHYGALAATACAMLLLVWNARRAGVSPKTVETQNRLLAALLPLNFVFYFVTNWLIGDLTWKNAFPCHLCDMAAFCGSYALLTRSRLCAELTWFWGLAGTLNGLITPALVYPFPHPGYWTFFILHGGVVTVAVYLVLGLRMPPRSGAVWRVFGWTQAYFVLAVVMNLLTGANYGFLRDKPANPSLLDHLGPWPWYILCLEALALVFFTVLNLPFLRSQRAEKQAAERAAESSP